MQSMKSKIQKTEEQIKSQKENYKKVLNKNLQLDLQIKKFESKLEAKSSNMIYSKFQQQFSEKFLTKLRGYRSPKVDDGKFMLAIIREMYRDNFDALKNTTVTGRGLNKTAIPVQFYKTLKKLFKERLRYASQFETVDEDRKNSLKKIVKTAIESINKAKIRNEMFW